VSTLRIVDLTGRRFGRWTVVERAQNNKHGQCCWVCECECGTAAAIAGSNLRRGGSLSCGCLQREKTSARNWKHGGSKTAEYRTWARMKERCYNPNNKSFADYGGRGIKVCDRWRDNFVNFLADVGKRPLGKSLDRRPDNNGNYEPSNVRWGSRKQQNTNQRSPKKRRPVSTETRVKLSKALRGKPKSVETRAKLKAVGRSRIQSAETRAKISAVQRGKHRSTETRGRLSASLKAYWTRRKSDKP
jgi:NUMOD3 motif